MLGQHVDDTTDLWQCRRSVLKWSTVTNMDDGVIEVDTLKFEVHQRIDDLLPATGKNHVSVRWEPQARIVRLGVMIDKYTWDARMAVLDRLLEFEAEHKDDFALEFDIFELQAVENEAFADA